MNDYKAAWAVIRGLTLDQAKDLVDTLQKTFPLLRWLLDEIPPVHFINYLKKTGWKIFPCPRINVLVYQFVHQDENEVRLYQVMIPTVHGLRDQDQIIGDALFEVADKEKRSPDKVLLDIFEAKAQ